MRSEGFYVSNRIYINVQSKGTTFYSVITIENCGPGSSVGIATDYELDGPGWNPGGDEIFRQSRPVLGPTQPPVQWVLGLPRGWWRPGRGTDLPTPI